VAPGHERQHTGTGGAVLLPFRSDPRLTGVRLLCFAPPPCLPRSTNGRHLAMMPHPERCYITWQLPYAPPSLGLDPYGPSPWLKLFQNARQWCEETAPEPAA
jgi:CobB/CobQ-like glutamine amidotransferase domain